MTGNERAALNPVLEDEALLTIEDPPFLYQMGEKKFKI